MLSLVGWAGGADVAAAEGPVEVDGAGAADSRRSSTSAATIPEAISSAARISRMPIHRRGCRRSTIGRPAGGCGGRMIVVSPVPLGAVVAVRATTGRVLLAGTVGLRSWSGPVGWSSRAETGAGVLA